MSEPVRLSKRLIELMSFSRNEAQKYIEGGWVLVDGEVIDEPQFMVLDQKITMHPDATLAPAPPMTILFHMPKGYNAGAPTEALSYIKPETREANDASGIRTLKRHFARLAATAPLEARATGLMVFSQDGRVVRRLVKDSSRNEQEYIVEVSGDIEQGGLERLNRRMKQNNVELPAAKVSWQNETRLRFAFKDVRPSQIEFMCNSVGLTVEAMKRIRIGRIPLAKLPPGQWRYLSPGILF